jgi:hypothetical protein
MIRFNAAPAFDFDEWAALHRRDPEAFEARRRALLAIEVARGGHHAPAGRALIEQLDAQLDGCDGEQRLERSVQAMLESARALTAHWDALADTLRRAPARTSSPRPD